MAGGAQLSVTDMRRSTRHPVDFSVIAEHLQHGDMKLQISNISAHGFMVSRVEGVDRGDRMIIRLPSVGRIEAYCIWTTEDRAGFQFERIIRLDSFESMISEMQPNPALRRRS
ncbi:PilZ domain-containing protein [Aurantiacibacter rhizosphaerae]|uniref:PilZ domain-containing protein n=1 Tax=Aurantiacibacter rhizosphaerae TaxID=2691582 RepID=A0A844XER2_9SPHN|nr:PilZ domain-containing protein [Aurantiacibacter rhizosphaerae]MWV27985.1 PilZ domain-containing protein [Aurantiacibacter rhizosphaerae]